MIAVVAHVLVALTIGLTTGVWPLQPRPEVVQGFSPPATMWGTGHRGVDLLGHPGQQVHATESGTISFAGRVAGRGVVVVNHGVTRTTYEPVSARVHAGANVPAGAVIGSLEMFPSHCWPRTCLHWGLIRGDTYLDPLTLVGAGPVRLLPLGTTMTPFTLIGGSWDTWSMVPAGPWALFTRPGGAPDGRPVGVGQW
jgi:murein DD-endopeptidase MepM/ murein hydrolase activator NlpD